MPVLVARLHPHCECQCTFVSPCFLSLTTCCAGFPRNGRAVCSQTDKICPREVTNDDTGRGGSGAFATEFRNAKKKQRACGSLLPACTLPQVLRQLRKQRLLQSQPALAGRINCDRGALGRRSIGPNDEVIHGAEVADATLVEFGSGTAHDVRGVHTADGKGCFNKGV